MLPEEVVEDGAVLLVDPLHLVYVLSNLNAMEGNETSYKVFNIKCTEFPCERRANLRVFHTQLSPLMRVFRDISKYVHAQ